MYKPYEVIFCPTNRCNLHCKHCYIARSPIEELSIGKALSFMEESYKESRTASPSIDTPVAIRDSENSIVQSTPIDTIGFSGGEPFLALEFMKALSSKALELNLSFDRIMTNARVYTSQKDWQRVLQELRASGYDGRFGVSYDYYHESTASAIAPFIKAVKAVYGLNNLVDLTSVNPPSAALEARYTKGLKSLASILESTLIDCGKAHSIIQGEYFIHIDKIARVYPMDDPLAWGAASPLATTDYCQGPGNVLYVLSNSTVSVCCGFNNESPKLLLGTIDEGYSTLLERAKHNPMVRACYKTGLGNIAKANTIGGLPLPPTPYKGFARDMCTYCQWLCQYI